MAGAARFGGTGLQAILSLNAWIAYQLSNWEDWARGHDGAWLSLPTGNPAFPALGVFFRHAFTPLHRYSDQACGVEAADDSGVDASVWPDLTAWAWQCVSRHAECLGGMEPAWLDRPLRFKTRSAGELEATVGGALAHAATHCIWHLGGIAHLLRQQGIAPPGRSDMIFWLSNPVPSEEPVPNAALLR